MVTAESTVAFLASVVTKVEFKFGLHGDSIEELKASVVTKVDFKYLCRM